MTEKEQELADRVAQLEAQVQALQQLFEGVALVKLETMFGDGGTYPVKIGKSTATLELGVWHLLKTEDAAVIEAMQINPTFNALEREVRKLDSK